MTHFALYAAFFCSGASALLFQTLWFRQVGLALGNSVWASSLVLASFMAGLGLGSGLAARTREGSSQPLRLYAALEAVIGLCGVALAFVLPALPAWIVPALASHRDSALALHGLRLAVAFALLLVPTTAMGATLPVLVRCLSRREGFGPALGRLYGWNTMGAVAGSLAGELVLIERLGLRGSGMAAAALNLLAASAVLFLSRRMPAEDLDPRPAAPGVPGPHRGLLAAAGVCGFTLLALEVVWFRVLLLFVASTSLTFALLLAVVLVGISGGAFAGAAWLRRSPEAPRWLPAIALAAGATVVLGYEVLDVALALTQRSVSEAPAAILGLAATLMLPTSAASGLLFSLLGAVLERRLGGETRSAGLLTLANTSGALLGALAGGLLLLPRLGSEIALFLLAAVYGGVALLTKRTAAERAPGDARRIGVALAVWVLVLVLYPFGLMERSYVARVARRYAAWGSRTIAFREGLVDSLLYMRKDVAGEPASYRLVINSVPMSASGFSAERYMKAFVYWALAVRPDAQRALLISYGLGSTAAALTDSRGLRSIDVVDISPDVLRMGRLTFPPPASYPLDDPRVRTHVEDGRFFLLAGGEPYDLITAEPPPPRAAGVVNLYSQEYFALVHDRLTPRGVVTYWLPVFDLDLDSTRSIVRGFCNVFSDCSLWTGSGFNWMLAGTRGLRGPVGEAGFLQQWRDPEVARTLKAVALENPPQLGALFLADAEGLRTLAGSSPPLVDDFPLRLSRKGPQGGDFAFYTAYMNAREAGGRFASSRWIAEVWPDSVRAATLPRFEDQDLFNRNPSITPGLQAPDRFPLLHAALTQTCGPTLPLLIAGSDPREQQAVDRAVARGTSGPVVDLALGLRALAAREYEEADRRFRIVEAEEPGFTEVPRFRALALCLGGRGADAGGLFDSFLRDPRVAPSERTFWSEVRAGCAGSAARALERRAGAHDPTCP